MPILDLALDLRYRLVKDLEKMFGQLVLELFVVGPTLVDVCT